MFLNFEFSYFEFFHAACCVGHHSVPNWPIRRASFSIPMQRYGSSGERCLLLSVIVCYCPLCKCSANEFVPGKKTA